MTIEESNRVILGIILAMIPLFFMFVGFMAWRDLRKQAKKDAKDITKLIQQDRWRQKNDR